MKGETAMKMRFTVHGNFEEVGSVQFRNVTIDGISTEKYLVIIEGTDEAECMAKFKGQITDGWFEKW